MCRIKIPLQGFVLKMQGELMHEGGVFAGHYGILDVYILILQIPRLIWECLHMHKLGLIGKFMLWFDSHSNNVN